MVVAPDEEIAFLWVGWKVRFGMATRVFVTALSALFFLGAPASVRLHAEDAAAGEVSQGESFKVTVEGQGYEGTKDPGSSDYAAPLASLESVTVAFRPKKEAPLSWVSVSFTLVNGKLDDATYSPEVKAMVRGGGYLSSTEETKPKVILTKREKRGEKLYVEGSFTGKLLFSTSMVGRNYDESKAREVTIEFSTEVAPL